VPLWKDPSIYHYMAWGIEHGMVPYRDTIDPNWPGVLPLHWIAQALSGTDPWGMRVVDAILSFALLSTSAFGLAQFGVPFAVRAATLLTWFALYLSDPFNPYGLTLQRDALQLPFVAPFWIACMRTGRVRGWALVGIGIAAGFAVWMKPTIGLFLATGYLVAARDRSGLARLVALTGAGITLACAAMTVFLFGWCDTAGFWTWGVEYAFGPYAAVRHPFALGVRYVFHQLLFAGSPLPFAMLVLGYVGIRVRGAPVTSDRWRVLIASLPWIVATMIAFLVQGKLFAYQALPIHWTLLMAGALWFGTAFEARRRHAVLVVVAALFAVRAIRVAPRPLDDEVLATSLAPEIRAGDQVVVVGCLPGLLFDLQVRTPLPEVCSTLVYYFGSDETHALVGRHLDQALRNPSVRLVVIEKTHPVFEHTSGEMLERWAPPLASLGYERAPALEPSDNFEVYRR
jgi:hypothetical protein